MTKKEYMDLLSKALLHVEPEVARDIMEDYEAHFERAKESGRSDEEVIAELGSIEEFTEELNAFMSGKKGAAKSEGDSADKMQEERVPSQAENAGVPGGNDTCSTEALRESDGENDRQEEAEGNKEEEYCDRQTEQLRQVDIELSRAREEMKRAYEEMMRAKEELERAKMESEREKEEFLRAKREKEQKEKEHMQDRMESGDDWNRKFSKRGSDDQYTYWNNSDINNIKNSAKNITSSVLSQISGVVNKTFSGFNDWMVNFEKSGEDMTDYRRRQENAKSEAKSYQRRNSQEAGKKPEEYNYVYEDIDSSEEQYVPECRGIVTEGEGIRHIVVDSKSAEVDIAPSEDNNFNYHYINEGSAGSKILYRCEKRVSQGTLTISIVRDEKAERKNHFSILGGVFEENADLRLELSIPDWVGALEVNGKSGDIQMRDLTVSTLMLKSTSGDVTLCRVNSDKCMVETLSGDASVKNGKFGYVLASSKSGDAEGWKVKAEKAAVTSMSGDARVRECELDEMVVSSMSGDADTQNTTGRIISVSSMSGDVCVKGLSAVDAKISSMSGDACAEDVKSDNLLITGNSGDIEGNGITVKMLKASVTSGDMSIRGHVGQMNLTSGSGDVIVVQEGDTKASVNTRSGEVHFHLKNSGAGFASKVSTHGETNYRYQNLHLNDAANGIHRYGAEGSSIEIQSTSGDISITD